MNFNFSTGCFKLNLLFHVVTLQVKLKDSLVSSLEFQKAKDIELTWIDGQLDLESGGRSLMQEEEEMEEDSTAPGEIFIKGFSEYFTLGFILGNVFQGRGRLVHWETRKSPLLSYTISLFNDVWGLD